MQDKQTGAGTETFPSVLRWRRNRVGDPQFDQVVYLHTRACERSSLVRCREQAEADCHAHLPGLLLAGGLLRHTRVGLAFDTERTTGMEGTRVYMALQWNAQGNGTKWGDGRDPSHASMAVEDWTCTARDANDGKAKGIDTSTALRSRIGRRSRMRGARCWACSGTASIDGPVLRLEDHSRRLCLAAAAAQRLGDAAKVEVRGARRLVLRCAVRMISSFTFANRELKVDLRKLEDRHICAACADRNSPRAWSSRSLTACRRASNLAFCWLTFSFASCSNASRF